jgi:SAM-dependent methyltransferase
MRRRIKQRAKDALSPRVRARATDAYLTIRALGYRGTAVRCPCCGGGFRRFLPVVPGAPDSMCPRCGSFERHRLLWLFLHERTDLFTAAHRVLDVAPERTLSGALRRAQGIEYISGDLESPTAMVRLDVTDLPFRDGWFDVVFCNHVLEHVPDDRRAMRELRRVLSRDGFAILQTPFEPDRATTFEDRSIVGASERERVFGHPEHVRIYGRDIHDRLREAGFAVRLDPYVRTLPAEVVARYGLDPREEIFFCTHD